MRERPFVYRRIDDATVSARFRALRDAGSVPAMKYFPRFDTMTKEIFVAACEAIIALGSAAVDGAVLLISSRGGASDENRAFFDDYVKNGRELARGNLFVHTLPTAPLAEIAICFGITGPLMYVASADGLDNGVRTVARGLLSDGYPAVLSFIVDAREIQTWFFTSED